MGPSQARGLISDRMVRAVEGVAMERGVMWWPVYLSRCGTGTAPPRVGEPHQKPMPGWPIPEGRRCITIELDVKHVEHLDHQADYLGCSRAAYLRQLIVRDVERQGPAVAKA